MLKGLHNATNFGGSLFVFQWVLTVGSICNSIDASESKVSGLNVLLQQGFLNLCFISKPNGNDIWRVLIPDTNAPKQLNKQMKH